MHRGLKNALLGTSGIGLIFVGGTTAYAQEALETVVVTAEKQATDIQKTGVSITAIQPADLAAAGQTRLADALAAVPSVQIYRAAQSTNGAYFIRGIGTTQGVNSTLEMVDNVNMNPIIVEAMMGADAARVEVLRGPQGTLYGEGAFGGIVNVVTNDPTDKYEGKIFVEGGSYNEVKANAMVNIPFSDDMALRVVAVSAQQTGFMHPDGRGNIDFQMGRAKLEYKPSDAFHIVLSAALVNDMAAGSTDTIPQTVLAQNFASPAYGGFNPCGGDPHPNKYDPWHSPPKYYGAFACTVPAQQPVNPSPVTGVCQQVDRTEHTVGEMGFNADYDMGWSTLTVLGNHEAYRFPQGPNAANNFLGTTPGQNLFSNVLADILEARIASEAGDTFKWLAGVYWERDHDTQFIISRASASPSIPSTSLITTDKSAYGQVTVPVADRFRVIGGLRYAMDDAHSTQWLESITPRPLHFIGKPSTADLPTHKLVYKAGIEFDITDSNMFYANTSTGYRPTKPAPDAYCVGKTSGYRYLPGDGSGAVIAYPTGGCATTTALATGGGGHVGEATVSTPINISVPPDFMTAYEAGFKNRFLDNRVEVNIDGFYYNISRMFISALRISNINQQSSGALSQTGAKVWGPELETTWLLTDHDKIGFNLSYITSESGISPYATPQCFNYGITSHPNVDVLGNTTNLALCSARNLAANPISVNWVRYRSGVTTNTPLFNSPKWDGNVSYQHIFDLSSGATVTAMVQVHFESSYNGSSAYYYDGLQPAYHETNFALTYDTADSKWEVSAWVNNIENTAVNGGAQSTGSGLDYVYPTYNPPRMWGVNLTAKF